MHNWGQEDVDWNGISDAAEYIGLNLRRWGRVGMSQWKEKWGTVRVYCSFGWYQLHSITHPGWVRSVYPQWLWWLDCHYLSRVVGLLNPIVCWLQARLYTYLYGRALRKWPHLRLEILSGADYPELLQKYGVHLVRDSKNGYTIHIDWHENNFVRPETEEGET